MSAIALPLIYSPNTTNQVGTTGFSPVVNAEHIHQIAKMTAPEVPNSSNTPKFRIVFTVLGTDNQVKSVNWDYADETTLDADLALIYAATSASI